jgi:hypothetical protein
MQLHVMPRLVDAITLSTSFDLLMSKGGVDTFVLVINYLNESWMPQHVTISLFEFMRPQGFPWLISCVHYIKNMI